MADPIIIVAGVGRCGSSLIMQMLVAGGVRLGGTGAKHPTYECSEYTKLPHAPWWLGACHGKVIKIINPGRYHPPKGHLYKVIWAQRRLKNQTDSWMKWQERLIEQKGRRRLDRSSMIDMLVKRSARGMDSMRSLQPIGGVHLVRFESALKLPNTTATEIAMYLGLDLDTEKMTSVVAKRSPECLPFFMEDTNQSLWPTNLS